MLFVLALVAPWLWWRRLRLQAVVLVCAALLVVLPWSIRNTVTYGRFVAVASEGGITFWTGNHPLAIGEGDLAANPELKRANAAFRQRHPGLTAEALEPIYYREALAWMRDHPGDWMALMARKVFYAVVPIGPSYRLHSQLYYWGSVLPYLGALAAAIMGGVRIARRGRLPVALLLLAAASLVMSLLFFPQERFRIPAIDPLLIVLAAGAARPRADHTGRTP
jgi:4-amino-4-deoxy-L-arabinose transferase-like glycosyltransferase